MPSLSLAAYTLGHRLWLYDLVVSLLSSQLFERQDTSFSRVGASAYSREIFLDQVGNWPLHDQVSNNNTKTADTSTSHKHAYMHPRTAEQCKAYLGPVAPLAAMHRAQWISEGRVVVVLLQTRLLSMLEKSWKMGESRKLREMEMTAEVKKQARKEVLR